MTGISPQDVLARAYNACMRLHVRRTTPRIVLCLAAAAILVSGSLDVAHVQTPTSFVARIAQLSESGGFFDTDNLISNERSYLHVIPALHEARLAGGVYIGVGP